MKTLGMRNLEKFLEKIVKHKLHNSLMIWGAPGIGKSSVVQSIANKNKLELIDLRISQLAPTDLEAYLFHPRILLHGCLIFFQHQEKEFYF